MPADATLAVQAAIVAALKSAAGVTALVGQRVYDRAPDNVTFPYVSIGSDNGQPWDAHEMSGWEMTFQLDVWSRKSGSVEARQIMAATSAALDEQPLTVAGETLVRARLIQQLTMDDQDGVTVHGVQRFRFITHR